MTAPHDPQLRSAWNDFCDALKEAGDVAFRETAASNPVDRAAGTGIAYFATNVTPEPGARSALTLTEERLARGE